MTAKDAAGCLGDPAGVDDRGGFGPLRKGRPHHWRDGLRAAQHGCGFAEPSGALLSQGSGFMFGVAGLQCRLLRQMQRFNRSRRPAMIMLELDGQLAAADVDLGTPGRPALVQSRVDPDDLPDRPLRWIGAGPFGKPHTQCLVKMLLERGVVGLRRCDISFEQHPPVDRQPPPIDGLYLVRHCDVGVQIRVARPAVPVGERRGDQASDVDLPDPLRPGPGEQGMLLDDPKASLTAA